MSNVLETTYPVDERGYAIIPKGCAKPKKIGVFKKPGYLEGNRKPTDNDIFLLSDNDKNPIVWDYTEEGIRKAIYELNVVKDFASSISMEFANLLFLRAIP